MQNKDSNTDKRWMEIAELLAKDSKCVSRQVGCVLVRNNAIISTGVNGTSPGHENCCDHFDSYDPSTQRDEHHAWSRLNEHHAEVNLFGKILQNQTEISGSTLYVTLQPCEACTSLITVSGIRRVVFANLYDKGDQKSIDILRNAGIVVDHMPN